jgi:hypothetical protein
MLLTNVVYAPIPPFEKAASDTLERVVGQPTLDQGLQEDPLGRLVAAAVDAKVEDRKALERVAATKGRRGKWPEMLDAQGDPTEGKARASRVPKKSPFEPLPDVAFSRVMGGQEPPSARHEPPPARPPARRGPPSAPRPPSRQPSVGSEFGGLDGLDGLDIGSPDPMFDD